MDKIPPPPKSLTSYDQNLNENDNKSTQGKGRGSFTYGCNNKLDEELMKLRREMPLCFIDNNQVGLRQLDMSLLSQLNALKQSISEYKKALNVIVNGDEVEHYGDGQFNGQYSSSLVSMDQENDLPGDEDEIDGDDVITSDDEREEDGEEENSERSSESIV
ncbi:protein FAM89A-like isoform X1 [Panonychus citri]|uniref:protein FAM89A-like isoform X1 n=1 Tax=Panonychus citri TaxID=50023 RepID=UPI00230748FD|nr:protein FAM89A-like isoform X1 [Panonychus citri]